MRQQADGRHVLDPRDAPPPVGGQLSLDGDALEIGGLPVGRQLLVDLVAKVVGCHAARLVRRHQPALGERLLEQRRAAVVLKVARDREGREATAPRGRVGAVLEQQRHALFGAHLAARVQRAPLAARVHLVRIGALLEQHPDDGVVRAVARALEQRHLAGARLDRGGRVEQRAQAGGLAGPAGELDQGLLLLGRLQRRVRLQQPAQAAGVPFDRGDRRRGHLDLLARQRQVRERAHLEQPRHARLLVVDARHLKVERERLLLLGQRRDAREEPLHLRDHRELCAQVLHVVLQLLHGEQRLRLVDGALGPLFFAEHLHGRAAGAAQRA
mmetsp:Transcript_15960/g.43305  ORF Transcript_15960/g.43305 Transcript_15960/m.43305 type:complete len:327 (-) Transcript_15960:1039-2019(-)